MGWVFVGVPVIFLGIDLCFGQFELDAVAITWIALFLASVSAILYRVEVVIDKRKRVIEVTHKIWVCPISRINTPLEQFDRVVHECARTQVTTDGSTSEVVTFGVSLKGPPGADGQPKTFLLGSFAHGDNAEVYARSIGQQVDLPVVDEIGSTMW